MLLATKPRSATTPSLGNKMDIFGGSEDVLKSTGGGGGGGWPEWPLTRNLHIKKAGKFGKWESVVRRPLVGGKMWAQDTSYANHTRHVRRH